MDSPASLTKSLDPYYLLRIFSKEAKIKKIAYGYSEEYYLNLWRLITYPLVVLAAISTVLAGLDVNQYALLGLNLAMLILTGFERAINPKEKEQNANKIKIEYAEIHNHIKNFIYSNSRTKAEIKAYSDHITELLSKWNAFSPPIFSRFINKAQLQCADRKRTTLPTYGTTIDIKRTSGNSNSDEKKT